VLKAVLVGCGAMSRAWLEAARQIDDLSIAGLVDIDVARARSRASEFALADAQVGESLEAVLDQTRPDVVFDVVVPSARASVAFAAFKRGCHVLSEKPLAANLEEAHALIAAAQAAGVIHAVVQNRRYIAPVRRIRRFVDSGAIGWPTSIHCDFFLAPHFGGFREEMDHVLLHDMAIHTFDAARAMTGLEARRVYCHEWNPVNSWYRHGSSAAAIFEMSNGAVFNYRGSWCADGARTSWEAAWRIVGERGSLTWDGFDTITAEVAAGDAREGLFFRSSAIEVPPLDAADAIGGHLAIIRQFVAAVRGGPLPETVSTDNLNSLAMVFAAIRSAETGQRVAVET
jgi:predicted dehydrogenase